MRCTAKSRSGERCKLPASQGLDKCRFHCGLSKDKREQKGRANLAMLTIEREMDKARPEVNPIEALLACISEAAYWVAALRHMTDHLEQVHGPNHLNDGAPHVLVVMLGKWTDRLAHYSKLAIEAGLEERMVRLAEQQASIYMRAIEAGLSVLDVGEDDKNAARREVARHLRAVS